MTSSGHTGHSNLVYAILTTVELVTSVIHTNSQNRELVKLRPIGLTECNGKETAEHNVELNIIW